MPELPREEVRVWRQHYACDECGEPMTWVEAYPHPDWPTIYAHSCKNGHRISLKKQYPLITYAALEALCLHGQSFGFARDDVQAIRQSIAGLWALNATLVRLGYADVAADGTRRVSALSSIADRIEALLPPETPNG